MQVSVKLLGCELVPRRIGTGKPARFLMTGRDDVVVHQRDDLHQQIPR